MRPQATPASAIDSATFTQTHVPFSMGRALLFVALFVGIGFRFIGLSDVPLSFDEAATVNAARQPLSQVYELNKTVNSAPPLTLFLLHGALKFGSSEWMVRIFPFFAGVLLIPAVFLAGKESWLVFAKHESRDEDRIASLCGGIASLLIAVSPFHVVLSREFRAYSIGSLIAAIATVAALRYVRQRRRLDAGIFAAAVFVGLQVQYGLVFTFAGLLAGLTLALYPYKDRKPLFGHAATAAAAFLVGIALSYFTALRFQFYVGRGSTYTADAGSGLHSIASVAWLTLQLIGAQGGGIFVILVFIGFALLFVPPKRHPLGAAALFALAFTAAAFVAKMYVYGPLRQCAMLTIPLYAIAAISFVRLLAAAPARAVVVWGLCAAAALGPAFQTASGLVRQLAAPTVKTALATIDREFRPGDTIFVTPGAISIYEYYAPRFSPKPWTEAESGRVWERDERFWRDLMHKDPPYTRQLQKAIESGRRVWVLYTHYHPGEPRFEELGQRLGWLQRAKLVVERQDAGPVAVALYLCN